MKSSPLKLARLFLITLITCTTVAGLGYFLYIQGDAIEKPKVAFLSMVQQLGGAERAITNCWKEKKTFSNDCESLKESLYTESKNRQYFGLSQGGLLGIDYESHVVIMLTPVVDGENLKWQCTGSPAEVITRVKECREL